MLPSFLSVLEKHLIVLFGVVYVNANRKWKCLTSSKNNLNETFQTTSDVGCTSSHIRSQRFDERPMVRDCITTISASFATTKTFCPPRESLPPPGLSHMVSNERQREEGGKDAEWETLAPCKGASQAATTDKRKVSFSRVDCWRNLARRLPTVYSELHVPYFMSALLSFRLLLED